MEFDANLEVMLAALEPPPGYERSAAPPPGEESGPAAPFIFTYLETTSGPRDDAHRARLEHAPQISMPQIPAGLTSDPLLDRRLVSADILSDGALTEAVADQSTSPVRAVGRLTAAFGGKVRNCTGTVIAERIVLTAAHCVHARATGLGADARFADWITFEPGWSNGRGAGQWAVETIYIHAGWSRPAGDSNPGPYDYAFVRLSAPIAHVTGTASLMTDRDPLGPFTSMGYPRQSRDGFTWDGRFLYATTGNRLYDRSEGLIQAQNGLTEGSSGGPWFTQTDRGLAVVGINSTKPRRGDDQTWSPVFGDSVQALLARVLADMTGV